MWSKCGENLKIKTVFDNDISFLMQYCGAFETSDSLLLKIIVKVKVYNIYKIKWFCLKRLVYFKIFFVKFLAFLCKSYFKFKVDFEQKKKFLENHMFQSKRSIIIYNKIVSIFRLRITRISLVFASCLWELHVINSS